MENDYAEVQAIRPKPLTTIIVGAATILAGILVLLLRSKLNGGTQIAVSW